MNGQSHPRAGGTHRGVNVKRWGWLFLGILLWGILGRPVAAQTSNSVQPASVYVRSGPSDTYIAIGALFQGDSVTPVNRSGDSAWILVLYGRGTGWIPREAVTWQTDLAPLPVLPPDITPTARATQPLLLLSPTPSAAQGFVLVSAGAQALVRVGPKRGFARLGQLNPGTLVEPVSRNEAGDWILIRYRDAALNFDGFGWIARDLVQWRDVSVIEALPIITEPNLTPTATVEGANVLPTATEDASIMLSPTAPDVTVTLETPLPAAFPSDTPVPTVAPATETPTSAPIPTETVAPTVTLNLPTATETLIPTATTQAATATSEPPTATPTVQAVAQVATPDASATPDESRVIAAPASPTPTLPTNTPMPTATLLPVTPPLVETNTSSSPAIPLMALAAVVVASGLVYLGAFARAMPELRRYEQGFVRTDCPVCERGTLSIEEKRGSTLGIPSVRRTVRCNACRSVLREKGPQRWTYAVDRLENPPLYERFNGREITDDELKAL